MFRPSENILKPSRKMFLPPGNISGAGRKLSYPSGTFPRPVRKSVGHEGVFPSSYTRAHSQPIIPTASVLHRAPGGVAVDSWPLALRCATLYFYRSGVGVLSQLLGPKTHKMTIRGHKTAPTLFQAPRASVVQVCFTFICM